MRSPRKYPSSSSAVTAIALPGIRSIAPATSGRVCSGWTASRRPPASRAASRTPRPLAPDRCAIHRPGRTASPSETTTSSITSSGTPTITSSASAAASRASTTGTPGRKLEARPRVAPRPETATMVCAARCNNTATAVPTRPAPTTATLMRASMPTQRSQTSGPVGSGAPAGSSIGSSV